MTAVVPGTVPAFVAAAAVPVDLTSDRVVVVAARDSVLVVDEGSIDLFAVPLVGGRPEGRWHHLCRLGAGALVLDPRKGPRHGMVARAVAGTRLSRVPLSRLTALSARDGTGLGPLEYVATVAAVTRGLEAPLLAVAGSLNDLLPPRDFVPLPEGDGIGRTVEVAQGTTLRSVHGLRWVQVVGGAVEVPSSGTGLVTGGAPAFCLTPRDWLLAETAASLRVAPTTQLLEDGTLWRALAVHSGRSMYAIDRRVERRDRREREALADRDRQDAAVIGDVAQAIDTVLRDTVSKIRLADVAGDPPALAAARLVASRAGFTLELPPGAIGGPAHGRRLDALTTICLAARVHTRRVRIEGRWWRRDLGPLVGYLRADERPVALLPLGRGYVLVDDGEVRPVTVAVAAELASHATVLHRPLPASVTGLKSLLGFGLRDSKKDLWTFAVLAVIVSAVGLVVPVMTGAVLGTFVPHAQKSLVVEGSLVVVGVAMVVMAVSVVQSIAVLRLGSRATSSMQIGVFTRLLSLPASFFARWSTGELGTAVLGVNAAQEALSGIVTTAVLGFTAGAANLVLVWVYDVRLAALATGLVLLGTFVGVVVGWREVKHQRGMYRQQQRLSSRVFQLLGAVPKLRVAAAEDRALGVWAREFTAGRGLVARSRRVQNMLTTFNAVFPLGCTALVFIVVGLTPGRIGASTFLAFFTSFTLLLTATLQLTLAVVTALGIVPMFEQLRPLLEQAPESEGARAQPGDLSGRVALDRVSFRYGDDGPLVLDDVTINVEPGEFVALVGPSGSGKSTILRLLLGFDRPSSGTVSYDGQDLADLDSSAVRRQCGVVLQQGSLLTGTISSTIIGSSCHSVDDAWAAARMAGIDEDIASLPMGMHTTISEGTSTLSGGQRQRLLIARALVSRPRLVLFDEATSALDNPTQQVVADSTRQLSCTRVVVAHRLSTIAGADRVIVLDGGRIVQEGRVEDLLADTDGMFARLARRQS